MASVSAKLTALLDLAVYSLRAPGISQVDEDALVIASPLFKILAMDKGSNYSVQASTFDATANTTAGLDFLSETLLSQPTQVSGLIEYIYASLKITGSEASVVADYQSLNAYLNSRLSASGDVTGVVNVSTWKDTQGVTDLDSRKFAVQYLQSLQLVEAIGQAVKTYAALSASVAISSTDVDSAVVEYKTALNNVWLRILLQTQLKDRFFFGESNYQAMYFDTLSGLTFEGYGTTEFKNPLNFLRDQIAGFDASTGVSVVTGSTAHSNIVAGLAKARDLDDPLASYKWFARMLARIVEIKTEPVTGANLIQQKKALREILILSLTKFVHHVAIASPTADFALNPSDEFIRAFRKFFVNPSIHTESASPVSSLGFSVLFDAEASDSGATVLALANNVASPVNYTDVNWVSGSASNFNSLISQAGTASGPYMAIMLAVILNLGEEARIFSTSMQIARRTGLIAAVLEIFSSITYEKRLQFGHDLIKAIRANPGATVIDSAFMNTHLTSIEYSDALATLVTFYTTLATKFADITNTINQEINSVITYNVQSDVSNGKNFVDITYIFKAFDEREGYLFLGAYYILNQTQFSASEVFGWSDLRARIDLALEKVETLNALYIDITSQLGIYSGIYPGRVALLDELGTLITSSRDMLMAVGSVPPNDDLGDYIDSYTQVSTAIGNQITALATHRQTLDAQMKILLDIRGESTDRVNKRKSILDSMKAGFDALTVQIEERVINLVNDVQTALNDLFAARETAMSQVALYKNAHSVYQNTIATYVAYVQSVAVAYIDYVASANAMSASQAAYLNKMAYMRTNITIKNNMIQKVASDHTSHMSMSINFYDLTKFTPSIGNVSSSFAIPADFETTKTLSELKSL